jgi:hypothetical protein
MTVLLLIVGCGQLGKTLATVMSQDGDDVVIVELSTKAYSMTWAGNSADLAWKAMELISLFFVKRELRRLPQSSPQCSTTQLILW